MNAEDSEYQRKLAALRAKLQEAEDSPLVEDFDPEAFLAELKTKYKGQDVSTGRKRRAFIVAEMSEREIAALEQSEMSAEHKHLNDEVAMPESDIKEDDICR